MNNESDEYMEELIVYISITMRYITMQIRPEVDPAMSRGSYKIPEKDHMCGKWNSIGELDICGRINFHQCGETKIFEDAVDKLPEKHIHVELWKKNY